MSPHRLIVLTSSLLAARFCPRSRSEPLHYNNPGPGRGSRRRALGLAAADGFRRRRRPRPRRELPGQAVQRRLRLREPDAATRRRTSSRSSSRAAASARACRTSRSATWTESRACSRPGGVSRLPQDRARSAAEAAAARQRPSEQGPREHVALRGLTTATASSTSSSASDDWTDYGWDNAYDANGKWTNGPLRGFVYFIRNTGTNEQPAYDEPVKVMARRPAGGDLRLAVAELRRLRRRRRPRPDLRRVPRRLHLLREHRHAHRAEVRARPAREDAGRQVRRDGPGDDHADGVRLGQGRRRRSDRRRRRRPRGVRREHRQARRRTHAGLSRRRATSSRKRRT